MNETTHRRAEDRDRRAHGLTSLAALALCAAGALAAGCAAPPTDTAGSSRTAVVEDTVVTGRVRAALNEDPVVQAHQIDVETYRSVVQLSGFVDTAEQKARATEIARRIDGVRDVNNEIELRNR
jgi:hyperosmotically inducible protein